MNVTYWRANAARPLPQGAYAASCLRSWGSSGAPLVVTARYSRAVKGGTTSWQPYSVPSGEHTGSVAAALVPTLAVSGVLNHFALGGGDEFFLVPTLDVTGAGEKIGTEALVAAPALSVTGVINRQGTAGLVLVPDLDVSAHTETPSNKTGSFAVRLVPTLSVGGEHSRIGTAAFTLQPTLAFTGLLSESGSGGLELSATLAMSGVINHYGTATMVALHKFRVPLPGIAGKSVQPKARRRIMGRQAMSSNR